MRTRIIVALVTAAIIYSIRLHLHELAEMARTYSTFFGLLQNHPDLLYRHPQPSRGETDITPPVSVLPVSQTPKIIHHIALANSTISKYAPAIKSCQDLHPDWEHKVWTDANSTAFIAEHYPSILPHYEGYLQTIQRANILRYALLHKMGGVYLDLDVTCRVSLDSTPLHQLSFVSPGAHPAGVNNAFISTRPGHPFLAQLLQAVPSHDLYWGLPMRIPYVENMLTTGCMFFSNQWMIYVRDLLAGRQTEKVYILADGHGDMEQHMLRGKVETPIFAHGGASSWHSWDAAVMLFIGKHYVAVVGLGLAALALAVGVPLYLRMSSRRVRRKNYGIFGAMGRGIMSLSGRRSVDNKRDDAAKSWA